MSEQVDGVGRKGTGTDGWIDRWVDEVSGQMGALMGAWGG